ncbi:hypothetical protein CLV84_1824 [Neolewinella xylanilytica]|uniref:Uncharacterized protein n=1 Tax=Neolewinella xylanilytica TaxID=1514080 RepID=A0A2S6IBH0_9BACT|nr:hypothetical protein [Neolewinella xylanilytica]PPK88850.1 hypothetical protein CLV84_1824 [Neolewinella xylanilytica]
MNYVILRRSAATAMLACLFVFTNCVEDRENAFTIIDAAPSGAVELPDESVSETSMEVSVRKVLASVSRLPVKPLKFSELMVGLGYQNKAEGIAFDLAAPIESFEIGMARQDQPANTPLQQSLNEVFEILSTQSPSPTEAYESLNRYEDQFLRNLPEGIDHTEANVVLHDINLYKASLKILYPNHFSDNGNPKASQVVKDILSLFGLTVDFMSEAGVDACAVAILAAVASAVSCAMGNVFSCTSLTLLKLPKAFKTCRKKPVPWTCDMSPDPCCGVNCRAGYTCDYWTSTCVYDAASDPCQNCLPGQICANGRCVNP